ncbi:hypothetical protein [Clostridium perfringens]|uniref:hypothetical protein n=1 Tax=Clostridium perfringens TaxID=1502 RepID=UPI00189B959B|nr:hypothetical protein [Clostridium perfringens]
MIDMKIYEVELARKDYWTGEVVKGTVFKEIKANKSEHTGVLAKDIYTKIGWNVDSYELSVVSIKRIR